MKVADIVRILEAIAPPHLAADWDNVGLLLGDGRADTPKLLLCIDLTEEVLAEAVSAGARMVMAYHPVIFKPLSRLTADAAPVACGAARRGIAVYSMHTALDAAPQGTNDVLADMLGLVDRRPLEPAVRADRCKLVVFVPPENVSRVAEAAFAAGAGRIGNYFGCGFFCHGIGTFCGDESTRPFLGEAGRHEAAEELRLEVVAPRAKAGAVAAAVRAAHPYEEPAIDVYAIDDYPAGCGSGRAGRLRRPVTVQTLIRRVKKAAGLKHVSAALPAAGSRGDGKGQLVSRAACCAGSCGQAWRQAAAAGATFYLTGEMRHHDALAARAAGLAVVCLGHGNSERAALKRLAAKLAVLAPKVKAVFARSDRDPLAIL